MSLSKDIAINTLDIVNVIQTDSLIKKTYNSYTTAKDLKVSYAIFVQFLTIPMSMSLIEKSLIALPLPKLHPFLCLENREAFMSNLISFYDETGAYND